MLGDDTCPRPGRHSPGVPPALVLHLSSGSSSDTLLAIHSLGLSKVDSRVSQLIDGPGKIAKTNTCLQDKPFQDCASVQT